MTIFLVGFSKALNLDPLQIIIKQILPITFLVLGRFLGLAGTAEKNNFKRH